MSAPDISAIKARVAQQQAAQAPQPQAAAKREVPDLKTSRAQMEQFAQDFQKANEPEEVAVDVGELPENLKGKVDSYDDGVLYRGTSIDNPQARRLIESRLSEMDFGDLVMTGRVKQVVPIMPGKLVPTFQSLNGREVFWMEKNAHLVASTNLAVSSWLGYARLAMSIVDINNRPFEPHINKDGEVLDDKVNEKIATLLDMPEAFLNMLLVNYSWFTARIDALYKDDFELLKNG